ncbi:MAG: hypothetical protein KDK02_14415, partial [Rhodobacteraceae bacterium]|nr:hypothetical protein [Paracoccaceae bacterium]
MIRPGEALVFLSLAAGLHVGAWSLAGQLRGAGGDGAAQPAAVALAVATPQQSALMRDWQAPPDMTTDTPAPSAPPPATPPRRPGIEQAGPHLAPLAGLTPVRPAAPPLRRPDPLPTVALAPA